MLDEDELREMAASIAERGQYVPCRMAPDGLGLDGRNRVAACALAGVEPQWQVYDGDPVAFIVEVNAERRHLTTGQRAMAVAIGLGAAARKNGKWKRGSVPDDPRSKARSSSGWGDALWRAGLVLDHAPELADQVLAGDLALDAAQKQATDTRDRAARITELDEQLAALVQAGVIDLEEAETRVETEARIAALSEDLAARVNAGTLALDEAETIAVESKRRLVEWADNIHQALERLRRLVGGPIPADLATHLSERDTADLTAVLAQLPEESQ